MKKYRIGMDVGATRIKIGLFSDDMQPVDSIQILTDRRAALNELLAQLKGYIGRLLAKHALTTGDLSGIGAVFACRVDHQEGRLLETQYIMSIADQPMRELLERELGVKVYIDNDANAAALAEHTLGAGVGHDDLIYVNLSTGIGGSIIVNGKLFRGSHGLAGEVGHMLISDSTGYPCACGISGCVESISSGANMARYAADRIMEGEDSSILDYAGTSSQIDMIAVGKALRSGDALAQEVVNRGAEYLGRMFHSLNQVLDINVFVYGGGVSKLGEGFIGRIQEVYNQLNLLNRRYPAIFLPAKFSNQAAMYGAALLIPADS